MEESLVFNNEPLGTGKSGSIGEKIQFHIRPGNTSQNKYCPLPYCIVNPKQHGNGHFFSFLEQLH